VLVFAVAAPNIQLGSPAGILQQPIAVLNLKKYLRQFAFAATALSSLLRLTQHRENIAVVRMKCRLRVRMRLNAAVATGNLL